VPGKGTGEGAVMGAIAALVDSAATLYHLDNGIDRRE
jgi:hypothetical protein